mmetsp:Transcript_83859/g.160175  ORF Transcript_83859/g.160175 Transcript_83859/m.160175 type:complete len:230 (-) Transcript_83859:1323-2012(-)
MTLWQWSDQRIIFVLAFCLVIIIVQPLWRCHETDDEDMLMPASLLDQSEHLLNNARPHLIRYWAPLHEVFHDGLRVLVTIDHLRSMSLAMSRPTENRTRYLKLVSRCEVIQHREFKAWTNTYSLAHVLRDEHLRTYLALGKPRVHERITHGHAGNRWHEQHPRILRASKKQIGVARLPALNLLPLPNWAGDGAEECASNHDHVNEEGRHHYQTAGEYTPTALLNAEHSD